jgi:hypothetical protein
MLRLTGKRVETEQSMTEQVPEDLTEAEVADRLEVHRSEDEGARDRASEVDRRDRRGRARPRRLSLPAQERLRVGTSLLRCGPIQIVVPKASARSSGSRWAATDRHRNQ